MLCTAVALLLGMGVLPAVQDEDRIQKLIQTFSEGNKDERGLAVDDLVKIGRPAIEALKKAAVSSDLEVKGLAAQAIEKIEWLGLEKLKKYAKENLDEGSTVELSKIRSLGRWLPDTRIYEVTGVNAANGPAAMMGLPPPHSMFAIRKYEDGFHRLLVKGVYSTNSINTLLQMSKIMIGEEDAAMDFAIAYMELSSAGANQNTAAMMMQGASRLEKVPDGWALVSSMYGSNVHFKTSKDGMLTEIQQKGNVYNAYTAGGEAAMEERAKLEIEKLRLEVDALKRQLEKK
ncbi:MAG TPA: hypothetical protein VE981_03440 [Planctomycetota bacterium]|nr:hypothetical protein [Planctomycetota bacterium]